MQVKGYRYLEEENSDESDSEKSDAEEEIEDVRQIEEERDGDVISQGSHSPGPERKAIHGRRQKRDDAAYEQAGEREE